MHALEQDNPNIIHKFGFWADLKEEDAFHLFEQNHSIF